MYRSPVVKVSKHHYFLLKMYFCFARSLRAHGTLTETKWACNEGCLGFVDSFQKVEFHELLFPWPACLTEVCNSNHCVTSASETPFSLS